MRHFKTTEIEPEPQFTCDGLTEEDRLAIAMDEAADRPRGELNGFGYCTDCGLGPFNPGVYHCLACDQEDF